MDEGGLSGFGLSDGFQADAAPSAKLEPDFHHLNAGKLIEQLPGKATMTWASTRLGVKCQIGRMARSL
jgi:hypothetical protein